ncbi:MAG: peroxidase [Gemmatimonadales bacterium]|nr:MAG: peroxidase [Gemmatimonadales bacterium]
MSWIPMVSEEEAEGELAEVYREISGRRGKLSNIMRVQSLAPRAMKIHLDLYVELMFSRPGLSRAEREMIAVVVSVANDCTYCTLHHEAALHAWWKDADRVRRLRNDPDGVELSDRERALVEYAQELTRAPAEVDSGAIDRLREVGLADDEILQANMIIAYFNFVNRIAEGLGVEAPPGEVEGYEY